jgi:uncharacterized protein (DUF952 family)
LPEPVAYKILTADEMRSLEGDRFEGAPIDIADGYIHLSTAAQVAGTLDAHFARRRDLFLAAVDLTKCGTAIRWERSRGGALFPHLYGRLSRDLILASGSVTRDAGGGIVLPA